MKYDHVISGLMAKRDELSKQLLYLRTELSKAEQSVVNVDATIKLYDPEFIPESDYNRRPSKINRYFRQGEASMLVLDFFRDNPGTQATTAIVNHLAACKGIVGRSYPKSNSTPFILAATRS